MTNRRRQTAQRLNELPRRRNACGRVCCGSPRGVSNSRTAVRGTRRTEGFEGETRPWAKTAKAQSRFVCSWVPPYTRAIYPDPSCANAHREAPKNLLQLRQTLHLQILLKGVHGGLHTLRWPLPVIRFSNGRRRASRSQPTVLAILL